MLLAIDVRNTHTVVGLISGSKEHAKVVQQWRIRTESEITADELALTIDGLIGDDSERLTGAAALSTVPSVLHEVRLMLDQYWPSVPHVLIEPGVRTGIPLLVDNPKEVGADRIVNCLAAFHRFQSPAIVIDFGSSICVDVVSAKGEFLGGAIAPGLQVSSDAAAAR
ncbi:type III pantothenate kinase, partial [Mycobacterium avium]